MIWLLDSPAEAAIVTKTGDLCVEVPTAFSDLAGDNWTSNLDRNARGFEVVITDAEQTRTLHLSESSGCLESLQVRVQEFNGTFELTVRSEAVVNGVAMKAFRKDTNLDPEEVEEAAWTINTGVVTYFSVTKQVPLDQEWTNLLVGTMVFRFYDWNIGDDVGRDCCVAGSPGLDLDGTCPSPNYTRIAGPLKMQTEAGASYSSSLSDGSPGLRVDGNAAMKFLIAHEIGHVITDMRMGDRTETAGADAPLDHCQGQWMTGASPTIVPASGGGAFSKEFMGYALREGWANFVGAVTWNTRSQSSCEYQAINRLHDFNLDGNIDSNRANDTLDGAFDCEGDPDLEWLGESLSPDWPTATNWLEDAEGADDSANDGDDCVRDSNDLHESNRSTTYDVLRMFWDLTTDHDLSPGKLSDVFVDMCSREWAAVDPPTYDESLPWVRLGLAADFNEVSTEVTDEITHIAH